LFDEEEFNAAFIEKAIAFQEEHGLTADGLVGPTTYGVWLDLCYEDARASLDGLEGESRLVLAGELAVDRAHRTWVRDIIDPPDASSKYQESREWIDEFIRGDLGLGWESALPYVRDGADSETNQWCGAFVAWCWGNVGLDRRVREVFYASTSRLCHYARYEPRGETPNPAPPVGAPRRLITRLDVNSRSRDACFPGAEGTMPRAGDILLVGRPAVDPRGSHICLVESYDPDTGVFQTFEGNAHGCDPAGNTQEGVIRTTRRVGGGGGYVACALIRPAVTDLE
jgi:hypothetical protein